MKKAIVYYSMSGNADYVANRISEKLDADLIRISPKKEYPNKGVMKFFWGGKSAIMGETPELEDYE
ncbi:MAG: flavodoxin family protein, partial [Clostridia bacterium]|nr:flavodoxin family protein [Clostridia bacterium]